MSHFTIKIYTLSWVKSSYTELAGQGQPVAKTMKVFQRTLYLLILKCLFFLLLRIQKPKTFYNVTEQQGDILTNYSKINTTCHISYKIPVSTHLLKSPEYYIGISKSIRIKPNISSASISTHNYHLPLPVSSLSMNDSTIYLIS